MAFSFDNLTKKAKDIAALAADKTKDAADQVTVNVAIAGEQSEIPEAIREVVEAVAASKAKIAELEAEKEKEEEPAAQPAPKTCSVCGNVADSKFCPQCGAPMEAAPVETAPVEEQETQE